MRIREGNNSDPGLKKVGSGIRDKHPGSATLATELKILLPLSYPSLSVYSTVYVPLYTRCFLKTSVGEGLGMDPELDPDNIFFNFTASCLFF